MPDVHNNIFWTLKDQVSGSTRKLNKELDSIGVKSKAGTSAMSKLSSATGGLVTPTSLAAGGALALVAGLNEATRAAIDEETNIAKLDASLRANIPGWTGNTDAIEDTIRARERLAFTDDDLRDSLALLVAATHDVTKAQEIQSTAMDLARLKGISLTDASNALIKVEAGQFRILKSLGIQLEKGATQTEAMAAVQAVAAGQAEKYADTLGGKALAAQIRFNDKVEDAGQHALPFVADALTVVTSGLDALEGKTVTSTDEAVDLVEAISRFTPAGEMMRRTLDDLTRSTDNVTNAMDSRDIVDDYGLSIGTAASKTSDLAETSDDAKDAVKDMVDSIVDDGKRLIDEFYAPLEIRDKIRDNNNDITTAKRILNSKKSSAAEREDARDTIREAEKNNDELALELLATGKMSKKEHAALIADLKGRLKTATGDTKTYVQGLIDKVNQLDGMTASIRITTFIRQHGIGAAVHAGGFASGGFIPPNATATVGEEGVEGIRTLPGGGAIVSPNASSGTDGITLVYSPVYSSASPAEAQQFARMILPALVREQRRQGVA